MTAEEIATEEMAIPGGRLATRPLHFIWIVDCSGSMNQGEKIQTLNMAIREALPHMKDVAKENPNANLLLRVLKFSSGAQWQVSQPTPVESFTWTDLTAQGVTDMGKALEVVAEQLKIPPMESRALPPVLALISDGQPTDDFMKGIQALEALPWGKKAVRIAIGVGEDADRDVLSRFMGHSELEPLQANSPEALVSFIKWVSTVVTQSVSNPPSQSAGAAPSATPVPLPPPPGEPANSITVW